MNRKLANAVADALLATYALPFDTWGDDGVRKLDNVQGPEANLIHGAMAIAMQSVDSETQIGSNYGAEDASLADWPTREADIEWLIEGLRQGRFRAA